MLVSEGTRRVLPLGSIKGRWLVWRGRCRCSMAPNTMLCAGLFADDCGHSFGLRCVCISIDPKIKKKIL